jgi:filamentous hemagglutinin
VHADITADPSAPGNQQATVLSTANGVPQVNIQTPSAAGVSRNTYSRFDVDQRGAILNNSRVNTSTQLGGMVSANPWLAGGEARVILNEVNASDPSRLNGYLEVAGQRAQVVVANPAGIRCDGCGFINAHRATLTTGSAILENGALTGYRVQQGQVSVHGDGMDASRTDFAEIIARSVEINAGLWANQLKITTGANRVDAAHDDIKAISGTGETPAFALDVSHLGGMYAGYISLVGTEAGVGVNNGGVISATDQLVVRADGRLENSGYLASNGAAHMTVADDLSNSGAITANGQLALQAAALQNQGDIAAGDALSLHSSGDIDNSGMLYGYADVRVDTSGNIANSGTMAAHNNLQLMATGSTSRITSSDTGLLLAGLNASSGDLILTATESVQARGDNQAERIDIASDLIDLSTSTTMAAVIDARATTDIDTRDARVIADTSMTLNADRLLNDNGLVAAGQLVIDARDVSNVQGEISGIDTRIDLTGLLDNDRGLIDGSATYVRADVLTNQGSGRIYGDALAIAAQTLNNTGVYGSTDNPVIAARQNLQLGVQTLNNTDQAEILSLGDMNIGGTLDENQQAIGSAQQVYNASARIEAGANLAIATDDLQNLNRHLDVRDVALPTQRFHEYAVSGDINKYVSNAMVARCGEFISAGNCSSATYIDSQLALTWNGHGVIPLLTTPTSRGETFTEWHFDRNITETRVFDSAPGEIIAGGNIELRVAGMLNQDSRIIAGGALDIRNPDGSLVSDNFYNRETRGQRVTRELGTATLHWRQNHNRSRDTPSASTAVHQPAAVTIDVTLVPPESRQYQQVAVPDAPGAQVVRFTDQPLQLPNSSLYNIQTSPTAAYLIETDPRFTNEQQWLSSDYMLRQLQLDPANQMIRLGDGFYEQRLVAEQIRELTGQRSLPGFYDDAEAYLALMNNGVITGRELELVPGVALSHEQIGALATDIVWLVEQEVDLPDGSSRTVLVPRVYLQVQDGDLDGSGALLAGDRLNLDIDNLMDNSGRMAARSVVTINARDLDSSGEVRGNRIGIETEGDMNITGGRVLAGDSLWLNAGRDLNLTSTTTSASNLQGSHTLRDRIAGLYVSNPNGILVASAADNIHLTAAQIRNAGGDTRLIAGNDIQLDTLTESREDRIAWDARNYREEASSRDIGSRIDTRGDLTLQAGRDIQSRAAEVTSTEGAIALNAGRDIQVSTGEATSRIDEGHYQQNGGLSSSSTTTRDTVETEAALASTFSGARVSADAGRDLDVHGSNLVADGDIALNASNDVAITAASATQTENHFTHRTESGLMSSGLTVTLGDQEQSQDNTYTQTTAQGSTVGTTGGDVRIRAGGRYTQQGSRVLAMAVAEDADGNSEAPAASGGNIDIEAQQVDITEAYNDSHSRQVSHFEQHGLSAGLSSPIVDAVRTVDRMVEASEQSSDSRLDTLATFSAALALGNAANAMSGGPNTDIIALNVSLGHSQSDSVSETTSREAVGSQVKADGSIHISATSATATESEGMIGENDITVRGSSIEGANVSLDAEDNIQLLAAENTQEQTSRNSSTSGSVGLSIGPTSGIRPTASYGRERGHSDGQDVTWSETIVSAGDQLVLNSGKDATLQGAIAEGGQVTANIGGNLTIESLQDISTYTSDNRGYNVSVNGSTPDGGSTGGRLSINRQTADADYASVNEQTAIRAGDAGFDITVQGHSQLTGGVISSTQQAVAEERNRLTTGTLGVADVQNHATADAESSGLTLGSDMFTDGKYGAGKGVTANLLNNGDASDSSSSTTYSAISEGTIVISNENAQQNLTGQSVEETLAALNHDTENTHTTAERLDVNALEEQAQLEQAIEQEFYQQAVPFTDETYEVMFNEEARVFEVMRDEQGQVVKDADGNPVMHELTQDQIQNLTPGADGKVVVFTNGIFNDEAAAGNYALDMSEAPAGDPVYLVYYPQADNFLSELLVAGYQDLLEGTTLGLSNPTQQTLDIMQRYGEDGLFLTGHSRGSMTIGNAMGALEEQPDASGSLADTDIRFVGPAYNAHDAANQLDYLSDGFGNGVDIQVHADDFVGGLIGGNPPSYDKRPAGSSTLNEWFRIFGDAPTVHSCYGNGGASPDCQRYGDAPTLNIQPNQIER